MGEGIFIYIIDNIPTRILNLHSFSFDIEGFFVGINLSPSENDKCCFDSLGMALDIYNDKYDKFLLTGDFNAQVGELDIDTFLQDYDSKNIVRRRPVSKVLKTLAVLAFL